MDCTSRANSSAVPPLFPIQRTSMLVIYTYVSSFQANPAIYILVYCEREREKGEMGFAVALMMIAASMLVGCINNVAVLAWDEPGVIHVGGKVLCQDCTQGWNEWVNGGKPIKGLVSFSI